MLLPLPGRRLYYDLTGPETAPVVCITHSLASDGGSWAEQVPALLQGGFRVLRLDMRGHGGSDPVAGDYTMAALADDVAAALAGELRRLFLQHTRHRGADRAEAGNSNTQRFSHVRRRPSKIGRCDVR